MERNEMLREFTFQDLQHIFLQRLRWLLLIPALCTVILYGYAQFMLVPQYTSTATMYILRQSGDELTINEAVNDYNLALKLVNDCTYLLRSHTVIDTVREELALSDSYNALCGRITTNTPTDTRILEVTVRADTPEMARDIVNRICAVGAESINNALGFKQITVFDPGILPEEPCNSIGIQIYALAATVSALIVFLIFSVWYMLDNTIHTAADVERYLGLSILGDIPDANSKNGHRCGCKYGYVNNHTGRQTKSYGSRKEK
ncbi:MAG: hypothetical protein IKY52_01105 [Clostridia bacterium]|nr:hypothetical protein [Clostridia bacterium]